MMFRFPALPYLAAIYRFNLLTANRNLNIVSGELGLLGNFKLRTLTFPALENVTADIYLDGPFDS